MPWGTLAGRLRDEAVAKLGSECYDVVISDMARDGVDDEGLRLLKRMRTGGMSQHVIFTVGPIPT